MSTCYVCKSLNLGSNVAWYLNEPKSKKLGVNPKYQQVWHFLKKIFFMPFLCLSKRIISKLKMEIRDYYREQETICLYALEYMFKKITILRIIFFLYLSREWLLQRSLLISTRHSRNSCQEFSNTCDTCISVFSTVKGALYSIHMIF